MAIPAHVADARDDILAAMEEAQDKVYRRLPAPEQLNARMAAYAAITAQATAQLKALYEANGLLPL